VSGDLERRTVESEDEDEQEHGVPSGPPDGRLNRLARLALHRGAVSGLDPIADPDSSAAESGRSRIKRVHSTRLANCCASTSQTKTPRHVGHEGFTAEN
jgi:hypothetical protein